MKKKVLLTILALVVFAGIGFASYVYFSNILNVTADVVDPGAFIFLEFGDDETGLNLGELYVNQQAIVSFWVHNHTTENRQFKLKIDLLGDGNMEHVELGIKYTLNGVDWTEEVPVDPVNGYWIVDAGEGSPFDLDVDIPAVFDLSVKFTSTNQYSLDIQAIKGD